MSAPRGSGEDRLIARTFRPLATHPGAMGLRDDAAFFTLPGGADLVLTKDALVAGVHFFPDDPPEAIARKALRVNLSDLAAKGAEPAGFLLALALNEASDEAWLDAFSRGLGEDAQSFGCPLFGGDTVKTPGPLTLSITAFGTLPHGTMVHRSGAQAGDHVIVTGTIGDAALGLQLRRKPELGRDLSEAQQAFLEDRYLLPQPRCALAALLRTHAHASMDVSDGLAGDLAKLCAESGVSAAIDAPHVPLSPAGRALIEAQPALFETALSGGDDYEILCCVPPSARAAFLQGAEAIGIPLTPIGVIVAGAGAPEFRAGDGRLLQFGAASYSHF